MKIFDDLYYELKIECDKIKNYYDVDKIKPYSVYIWSKGECGTNVFDILADKIVFYDKSHVIPDEAKLIIEQIQLKLKEIENYYSVRKD